MHRRRAIQICVALLASIAAAAARAQVVSNLSDPVGWQLNISTPDVVAGSFTTSTTAYTLTSVLVRVQGTTAGTSDLRFRADAGGTPGALLEDLGSQAIAIAPSTLTYNSIGTLLAPGTTYWVTMGEAGSGNVQ